MDRGHESLSVVRQCALLDISRSSLYRRRAEVSRENGESIDLMDRQYLATPYYGSRRMTAWLRRMGRRVNRKRVRRLMRAMGLQAIYRRPRTSCPGKGHNPGLSLSAERHGDSPDGPGVAGGHHLYPDGQGHLQREIEGRVAGQGGLLHAAGGESSDRAVQADLQPRQAAQLTGQSLGYRPPVPETYLPADPVPLLVALT